MVRATFKSRSYARADIESASKEALSSVDASSVITQYFLSIEGEFKNGLHNGQMVFVTIDEREGQTYKAAHHYSAINGIIQMGDNVRKIENSEYDFAVDSDDGSSSHMFRKGEILSILGY